MYERFYGLKGKPFQLAPNPRYLYFSKKHQSALTYLEYGLLEGSEFVLLTGEIGAGKTTLIRHMLNRIEQEVEVAVITNTNVDSVELLSLVLHEFGDQQSYATKAKSLEAIFQHLIRRFAAGKRVLLVIDEAQNLSLQALEEVRMLSNLQTDDQILLQIMLVGQPDLRNRLKSPQLTQLAQRIPVHYHLGALEFDEIGEYIGFRLEMAGGPADIFLAETFAPIYQASRGIPRIINILCDTALVYGYADSVERIGNEVIAQVIRDKGDFGLLIEPADSAAQEEEAPGSTTNAAELRLAAVEAQVALLEGQVERLRTELAAREQRAGDRLLSELTGLLSDERARTDRLLLECALLRAGTDRSPDSREVDREEASEPFAFQVGGNILTEQLIRRISNQELAMIDLHCHILPEIDDGPESFEEAVAMARLAVEDGIHAIVATPRIKEKLNGKTEISRRLAWLNHLLRKERLPLSILMGADVFAMVSPRQVRDFTINNTAYILLEFPHTHLPMNAGAIIADFINNGYRPILTHPERNPSVIANPALLQDLLGADVCVQITAGSLAGDFGAEAQECALHLLRSNAVDVIASDAHDATRRKPMLSAGMAIAAEVVGPEAARRMVFGNPVRIISGLSLNE